MTAAKRRALWQRSGPSKQAGLGSAASFLKLHRQGGAQVAIYATLIGDDLCKAEGIIARGSAPVLALARLLIEAGHDPGTPLEAWRGPTLCLRIRSLGEGAKFTVRTAGNGRPIFAPENGARGCPFVKTRRG